MLYHYCGYEKGLSILSTKSIRMSDIGKSNDSQELELFFPLIFRLILEKYDEYNFPFRYADMHNESAIRNLVYESWGYWADRFADGGFSNFVLCFSAKKDCLSQWRGYAEDGNGCCIGFSKRVLNNFCKRTNGVLRLEKVKYISDNQIIELAQKAADEILDELKNMRTWIVKEMTFDDHSPSTDGLLSFNFNGMIESLFTDSLCYKSIAFSEEQEWRIFFSEQGYKNPDWVYRDSKMDMMGREPLRATIDFLNKRIDFRWTSNDLIPFCPLGFNEFSSNPVKEIWLGPKNKTRDSDMELFLKKHKYGNVKINHSEITYR